MYNWSTDETKLKKHGESHVIWRLEQMVNFGLGGEKISEIDLKKYWHKIHIDAARRKFLTLLIDGTSDSRS